MRLSPYSLSRRLMKRFITNKYVLTILGCFLFLGIWIAISLIVNDTKMIFPDPLSTAKETFRILGKSYVYKCIGWTMYRMLIGFTISFAFALLLGIFAGHFRWLKTLMGPTIIAIKSVPTAALVFLFLIVSGARYAPIYIVILISFPILYESISAGISNVPDELIQSSKVDGARWYDIAFKIRLPLAIPYVLVGIASSFALSFKIEIMAEIITGDTRNGLGSAISAAQKNDPSNMTPIFAYSLVAIVFILLITLLEDIATRYMKKKIG